MFWWRWREKPLPLSEQKQLQGLRVLCRAQPLHWAAAILAKSSFIFPLHSWTDTKNVRHIRHQRHIQRFSNCSTHALSEQILILVSSRCSSFPILQPSGCPYSSSPFLQPLIKPLLALSKKSALPSLSQPLLPRDVSSEGTAYAQENVQSHVTSSKLPTST